MKLTTVVLFVIFNIIYYLVFVIGIGALGFSGKTIHGFSPGNAVAISAMLFNFAQAIVGFGAAHLLFRNWKTNNFIHSPYQGVPSKQLARLYAFAAIALLSYLSVSFSIFDINYSEAYKFRSENSSAAYLQTLFYLFSAISISIYISLGKTFTPISVILIAAMVMIVLRTGDKNALAFLFFAMLYALRIYNTKIGISRIALLSLLAIIILLFTSVLRFYRSGFDFQTALILGFYNFDVLSLDGAGPFVSILHTMDSRPEYLLGSKYINDIYNIIPRFIWPERPITIPEEFAQSIIKDWQPGMGLGYSPYAEAQSNWGPNFIFVHFFMFGAVWFIVWGLFARVFASICGSRDLISRIYYVFGVYLLLLSFRTTSLSFIKGMVHVFAAVFVVHACNTLLHHASRRLR
ncbi:MAG: hypothetical protein JKY60_12065 [Kordiimonadaceae bacterium]|nr:hypothetical protein [Kordiimonadaceae bacterium]